MRILDLFSGTGSATKAFSDAGHEVIGVELDEKFNAHERDVLKLSAQYLIDTYGEFDFIWASPPCTTFSIASCGHHWKNGQPSKKALEAIELVKHTIALIKELKPKYGYIIENPRGLLRKQDFMQHLPRQTITYCQYGDTRMKPTDLWGYIENWKPKVMCKNGDTCHEAAPRGAKTGTQGLKGALDRSKIPYSLGKELLEVIDGLHGTSKN